MLTAVCAKMMKQLQNMTQQHPERYIPGA